MRLPSKQLIISGAVALAIGIALSGTNAARQSSTGGNQRGFVLPFEGTASAQTATPATGLPSDKYFKKVTVLTGMPVDEFMGEMGLFSAALSYCCGDCHVNAGTDNPDWASDAKPTKVIARRMAAMVYAINKQNFGGGSRVTCWTCHRGSPNPAVTPAPDVIYGEPLIFAEDVLKAAPPGSGTPTIDQIFDKFTQAIGGAAAVAALTSYHAVGTSNLYEEVVKFPTDVWAKAPNQGSVDVHTRGGDSVRLSDGTHAWVQLPLTVVKEYPLNGSMLEGGKLEAELLFPGRLRTYLNNWIVSLPATINGRGVWTVQGRGANGLVATFYFDKETGLMTRYIRYSTTTIGRVPTQIDFSDFRPVAGVMMPFKWTYQWISGKEEYEINQYQPNVPVDASKFAEPKL
jgi:hypothetical protein